MGNNKVIGCNGLWHIRVREVKHGVHRSHEMEIQMASSISKTGGKIGQTER